MTKRKKSPASLAVFKFLIVGLLAVAVGVFLCQKIVNLLGRSNYFSIQAVVIDSSLSFIDKGELSNLKGKNIFGVDLSDVRRHLAFKYPQVSDLRIVRQYPNQIQITAKPRYPFAQIKAGDRILTLDEIGNVLASSSELKNDLFLIESSEGYSRYTLGLPYTGHDYKVALEIAKSFKNNRALSSYAIDKVDIQSTSKVDVHLSNELLVIFDASKITQKVKILGLLLAQEKVDPKEAKYIDLRFKEPIVGKK